MERRTRGRPRGGRRPLTPAVDRNNRRIDLADDLNRRTPSTSAVARSNRRVISVNDTNERLAFTTPPDNRFSDIGGLSCVCSHCKAIHFRAEKVKDHFSLCCQNGKVFLQQSRYPAFLEELLTAQTPTAGQFRYMIRKYNSAFSMVSCGADFQPPENNGPFFFRIGGEVHHFSGHLLPNRNSEPTAGQLYILDINEANNHRQRRFGSEENLNPIVLNEIAQFLNENNFYVQLYSTMKEKISSEEARARAEGRQPLEYFLRFIHEPTEDHRRFNDPLRPEVAAIFSTSDGLPPPGREFRVYPKSDSPFHIDSNNLNCDPLAYPLIWPYGETGWHINMTHNGCRRTNVRNRLTQREYICYKLAIRGDGLRGSFSPILNCAALFQQFIVDYYCRVEGNKLTWVRNNQETLRVDTYQGLSDAITRRADEQGLRCGRIVVLPSSFTGSPRNMMMNYQDAMAIVRKFGKPNYFITMTCNPKWPEIVKSIQTYDKYENRVDIVVRVFNVKLNELIDLMVKKKIFGTVKTLIYTIEFQKRGLPHAHILLKVNDDDSVREVEDIDKLISAEIPDPHTEKTLYDLVNKHMIHGPCGILNPRCVCMKDGLCTKDFPKIYIERTESSRKGYPLYRRRRNGNSIIRMINNREVEIDNLFVVPYNPFLLKHFRTHINIELCSTVQSVKYIYKYIYKGYDSANISAVPNNQDTLSHDEIKNYLNTRYVGPTEAAWRLFGFKMHYHSHAIERLPVHLENQNLVYFDPAQPDAAISRASARKTHLTAWFDINSSSDNQVLYPDMPEHYVWQRGRWQPRLRGSDKIIGRMYSVSPADTERYFLRLLLLNVVGAKSFIDLKTYEGVEYRTFKQSAVARGLVNDDGEWRRCLEEASNSQFPVALRLCFALILIFENPVDANELFEIFKDKLAEDFIRNIGDDNFEPAYVSALLNISDILRSHGRDYNDFGLPNINNSESVDISNLDQVIFESYNKADQMYVLLNEQQKIVVDRIEEALNFNFAGDIGNNAFFIDGPGGSGKTFIYKYIIERLIGSNRKMVVVAWTGIAAMLLKGGRTVHSQFKIPLKLTECSVSSLSVSSLEAIKIKNSSLIIWDEAPMASAFALDCVDRFLKDLMGNSYPFGGKVIVLGGDFRQVLPVVPRGNRSTTVSHCIKSSRVWSHFQTFKLLANMRLNSDEQEFSDFLMRIGNGVEPIVYPEDVIEIPEQMVLKPDEDIIDFLYGNIIPIHQDIIKSSAILCPKNSHCEEINLRILDRMPGESRIYKSINSICDDDGDTALRFPTEYLDSLEFSGLPPHQLKLKIGAVVILMRNLNSAQGLMNGTRLIVENMMNNCLGLKVLTGEAEGEMVLLPRIDLTPSDSTLPFSLKRRQFPVKLAFAMTINKSQGQTLDNVGIYLPEPVFIHGQLYVALSRARSFSRVKIKINCSTSGFINRTRNVVYKEIL